MNATRQTEQRIECESTRRLLCEVSSQGIEMWCRTCRRSHLVAWVEVERLQRVVTARLSCYTEGNK